MAGVGSAVTARYGDAPASPPWPRPKSLAAAPLVILKQSLKKNGRVSLETRLSRFLEIKTVPALLLLQDVE